MVEQNPELSPRQPASLPDLVEAASLRFWGKTHFINEQGLPDVYTLYHAADEAIDELIKRNSNDPIQLAADLIQQTSLSLWDTVPYAEALMDAKDWNKLFRDISYWIVGGELKQRPGVPEALERRLQEFEQLRPDL